MQNARRQQLLREQLAMLLVAGYDVAGLLVPMLLLASSDVAACWLAVVASSTTRREADSNRKKRWCCSAESSHLNTVGQFVGAANNVFKNTSA